MALARYQFTVVDDEGNVMPNASVQVTREVTGNPTVPLYTDRDGATPLGNPFNADADGFAAFHVAGGAYRITATSGAFSREWRYVGIGLASESDALSTGISYRYSSTTTDSDPGSGNFRFNHGTLASVTQIYFDNVSNQGASMTSWLDSWDDASDTDERGIVMLTSQDGTALFLGRVTGTITDGTGYRKVTVTPIVTAGSFVSGAVVNLQFTRSGADGTIGGTTGSTDNALLRADGTGGQTAQASSVTADDSGNLGSVARVGFLDTNASHEMRVAAGSDLTAHRTLTVVTGDENRTLTLNGDVTPMGQGKHTVWIPATAMIARTTNGAAAGTGETSTNRVMRKSLDFDASTQEFAQFSIRMPKSWNESTVTFQAVWSHAATVTNFGVAWQLAGLALSDDDAQEAAFGTEQVVTDTGGTTDDIYITAESSAITIGGTPAEGDLVVFQVARAPSNGSDTMSIDARLHGINLFYTTNAATDA